MKKWPRYPTSPMFARLLILVGIAPLLLLVGHFALTSDGADWDPEANGYAIQFVVAWVLIVASPGAILLLLWKFRKAK